MISGRPYDQCGYCGKWVRLAGFMAGWHLCLTQEERDLVDTMRQQQIHSMDAHYTDLINRVTGRQP